MDGAPPLSRVTRPVTLPASGAITFFPLPLPARTSNSSSPTRSMAPSPSRSFFTSNRCLPAGTGLITKLPSSLVSADKGVP